MKSAGEINDLNREPIRKAMSATMMSVDSGYEALVHDLFRRERLSTPVSPLTPMPFPSSAALLRDPFRLMMFQPIPRGEPVRIPLLLPGPPELSDGPGGEIEVNRASAVEYGYCNEYELRNPRNPFPPPTAGDGKGNSCGLTLLGGVF